LENWLTLSPIALKKIVIPLDATGEKGGEFDMGTIAPRVEIEEDRVVLNNVSARVRIDTAGEQYLARVTVSADGEWVCDRCGVSFERGLSGAIQTLFSPDVVEGEDDAKPIPAGTHELDLTQDALDAILLAVPYQILCREDCAGLCARCGADLNAGSCSCAVPPDPRWDALKAVRFDPKGSPKESS
jgi:uncharacterized protein